MTRKREWPSGQGHSLSTIGPEIKSVTVQRKLRRFYSSPSFRKKRNNSIKCKCDSPPCFPIERGGDASCFLLLFGWTSGAFGFSLSLSPPLNLFSLKRARDFGFVLACWRCLCDRCAWASGSLCFVLARSCSRVRRRSCVCGQSLLRLRFKRSLYLWFGARETMCWVLVVLVLRNIVFLPSN